MVTAFVLQQQLMTERQLLFINVPGSSAVYFPETIPNPVPGQFLNTFVIDPKNGPFPQHCNITEVIGTQTFYCEFVIEFFTIRSPSNTPSIVLSHRWTQEDNIDLDHYLTTRITRGKVIMRTDVALANNVIIDNFRDDICLPLLPNCQRGPVNVRVLEDGSQAEYSIVDEEKLMNFQKFVVNMGVTKIETTHSAEIGKPSVEDVLVRAGGAALRGIGRGAGMGGGLPNWLGGSVTQMMFALGFGLFDASLTAVQMLPRQMHVVTCKIWGNQISYRKQMERLATAICLERLSQSLRLDLSTLWVLVVHDPSGKFVEVQLKVKEGIVNAFLHSFGLTANAAESVSPFDVLGFINPIINQFANSFGDLGLQANLDTGIMPDIEYGNAAFAQPFDILGALPRPPSSGYVGFVSPPPQFAPGPVPPHGGQGGGGGVPQPPTVFPTALPSPQPLGSVLISVLPGSPAHNPAASGNLRYGGAVGSRGTMLRALLTQYLTAAYTVPGRPAAPPVATNYPVS
jgi:hypothetical protein